MVTVAELIVQEALARGNRHIFGIPGGGAGLSIVAAAHRAGIRFVLVNNEAMAAMAAAAYGRFVGAPGVCFSIQGTGGANMAGGIASCYLDRGPVVAITDRYPDDLLGRVTLQDVHLAQVFTPMVKTSLTLTPASARTTLRIAFDLAWAERPGPVHLDLPMDAADAQVREPDGQTRPHLQPVGVVGDLTAARAALENARRLVVFVGSDAAREDTAHEVREIVERCRAVVVANFRARGLFPEDHPRYGTVVYGNFVPDTCEMDFLTRADLVLAIGADPIELARPWPKDIPLLQVQLVPDLDQVCPDAVLRIFGPLKEVLAALARCTPKRGAGFSEGEIRAIRQNDVARYAPPRPDPLPAQAVMESARRLLPRHGILVQETGVYNVLNEHIWPVYSPDTYVSIGGSRTMGAAVPWAIGTALARPGVPILTFCGDGGFLMRIQELEVVARLGLHIVFVIFNDRQLGTIQARAQARGLDAPGLQFGQVNFSAIARAFGLQGTTVERLADFEAALAQALAADGSTVIDARLDPAKYTWLFPRMLGTMAGKKS